MISRGTGAPDTLETIIKYCHYLGLRGMHRCVDLRLIDNPVYLDGILRGLEYDRALYQRYSCWLMRYMMRREMCTPTTHNLIANVYRREGDASRQKFHEQKAYEMGQPSDASTTSFEPNETFLEFFWTVRSPRTKKLQNLRKLWDERYDRFSWQVYHSEPLSDLQKMAILSTWVANDKSCTKIISRCLLARLFIQHERYHEAHLHLKEAGDHGSWEGGMVGRIAGIARAQHWSARKFGWNAIGRRNG